LPARMRATEAAARSAGKAKLVPGQVYFAKPVGCGWVMQ
jgi:hypothetical protein